MKTRKHIAGLYLAVMLLVSMLAPLAASAQGTLPAQPVIPTPVLKWPDLVTTQAYAATVWVPIYPGGPLHPVRMLNMTIKNMGTATAGATTTRVTMSHAGLPLVTRTVAVPSLGSGAQTLRAVAVPAGYAGGSCRIQVDALNQVWEGPSMPGWGGESNNVRYVTC